VSAHGSRFLPKTFRTLVANLKPRQSPSVAGKGASANTSASAAGLVDGYDVGLTARCAELIHPLLHKILAVVPGSHDQLGTVLLEYFPHLSHSIHVQRAYTANLLRVLEYCPLLREKLLPALIDRLIRIDVEIKLEELPDAEPSSAAEESEAQGASMHEAEEVFGMDMDTHGAVASAASLYGHGQLSPEEEQRLREHRENASKLDCLLDLLMTHLAQRSFPEREDCFKILVRSIALECSRVCAHRSVV